MVLDARRQQLAYFAHNNTFHLVGLDGVVRSSTNLLTGGPHAALQYPLLSLGEDGTLHAAWTTHLMTAGRHASTDATMFHPRDGLPGAREIHNRTKTALETLKTRGIAVNVNAAPQSTHVNCLSS